MALEKIFPGDHYEVVENEQINEALEAVENILPYFNSIFDDEEEDYEEAHETCGIDEDLHSNDDPIYDTYFEVMT